MWDGGRVVVGISLQRRQSPEFLKRINPKFTHFYTSTPIFRESLQSSLTVILHQHCETQTQFFKQLISKQGSKWCTGNQTWEQFPWAAVKWNSGSAYKHSLLPLLLCWMQISIFPSLSSIAASCLLPFFPWPLVCYITWLCQCPSPFLTQPAPAINHLL